MLTGPQNRKEEAQGCTTQVLPLFPGAVFLPSKAHSSFLLFSGLVVEYHLWFHKWNPHQSAPTPLHLALTHGLSHYLGQGLEKHFSQSPTPPLLTLFSHWPVPGRPSTRPSLTGFSQVLAWLGLSCAPPKPSHLGFYWLPPCLPTGQKASEAHCSLALSLFSSHQDMTSSIDTHSSGGQESSNETHVQLLQQLPAGQGPILGVLAKSMVTA